MNKIIIAFLTVIAVVGLSCTYAHDADKFLSAAKIVHDCNNEKDKVMATLCSSYMIGLRDGLLLGTLENWNRPLDKRLSANTLIVLLTKYIDEHPVDGDEMAVGIVAKSLEKAGVIKRRNDIEGL